MMIEKIHRRLMKEGLLKIYRDIPEAIEYPIYYLPFDSKPPNYGEVVKCLHELSEFPWPDKNCIIISEDHLSRIIDIGMTPLKFIVRSEKEYRRYNAIPRIDNIDAVEPMQVYFAFFIQKLNVVKTNRYQSMVLTHYNNNDGSVLVRNLEDSIASRVAELEKDMHRKMTKSEIEGFREYLYSVAPEKSFWSAKELGSKTNDQIGLASDILTAISNIAAPCHYIVRSSFPNGFGTSSIRRRIKDKPIFSVIHYDRLYASIKAVNSGCEVSPHFRRGHIRYHWKQAGLNRFALPQTVLERLRIVKDHRVTRSYIPPMWVGEETYSEDDMRFTIMKEKMPLINMF